MGGLTSLKSAANTMVKKFDEIKEAMSTNNTPIKDYVPLVLLFFLNINLVMKSKLSSIF